MKLLQERKNDTLVILQITATVEELVKIKAKVLKNLAPKVKIAGFRAGKVPMGLVEKNLDDYTLQSEFLNEAINTLYVAALKEEKIRPVDQPKADVVKFVPYTTLEIKFEVSVVGNVVLPDYTKILAKRDKVSVPVKEVNNVIENLRERLSERKEVNRPAKVDDEAMIDFKGVDSKNKAISGADGTDYPLVLGSNSFIPGFEDNVVGMKIGDEKTFVVAFPDDYGAKHLQKAKVTFTVKLKKVMERSLPKVDDKFASNIGPFKSLEELTIDIKKQLEVEKSQRVERDFEAAILNELVEKTKVAIPDTLIEEQKESVIQELRQNVLKRNMTMQEYYASQGTDEESYIAKEIVPESQRRIKAGLLLSEIADKEGIDVTDDELAVRIDQLKSQYTDDKMRSELDKVDNQREIRARLRSEKVLDFLKK